MEDRKSIRGKEEAGIEKTDRFWVPVGKMKESEIIATLNRCSTRITTGVLWRLDNLAKKLSELDNSLVGEAYNAASTLRDINISLQETRRRIENEGTKK